MVKNLGLKPNILLLLVSEANPLPHPMYLFIYNQKNKLSSGLCALKKNDSEKKGKMMREIFLTSSSYTFSLLDIFTPLSTFPTLPSFSSPPYSLSFFQTITQFCSAEACPYIL